MICTFIIESFNSSFILRDVYMILSLLTTFNSSFIFKNTGEGNHLSNKDHLKVTSWRVFKKYEIIKRIIKSYVLLPTHLLKSSLRTTSKSRVALAWFLNRKKNIKKVKEWYDAFELKGSTKGNYKNY